MDSRELDAAVCRKLGITELVLSDAGWKMPPVSTSPEAFELVVAKLAEAEAVVEIDFGPGPEARVTHWDNPATGEVTTPRRWYPGDTWREAVCRAVLALP